MNIKMMAISICKLRKREHQQTRNITRNSAKSLWAVSSRTFSSISPPALGLCRLRPSTRHSASTRGPVGTRPRCFRSLRTELKKVAAVPVGELDKALAAVGAEGGELRLLFAAGSSNCARSGRDRIGGRISPRHRWGRVRDSNGRRPSRNVAGPQQGAQLIYLTPYSPELNPIEQAFAKFKAALRNAAERTRGACGRPSALGWLPARLTRPRRALRFLGFCGTRRRPRRDSVKRLQQPCTKTQ
jgi:transposase